MDKKNKQEQILKMMTLLCPDFEHFPRRFAAFNFWPNKTYQIRNYSVCVLDILLRLFYILADRIMALTLRNAEMRLWFQWPLFEIQYWRSWRGANTEMEDGRAERTIKRDQPFIFDALARNYFLINKMWTADK